MLTVDPGMNTGWAFWSGFSARPLAYGQITRKHTNLADDLKYLFREFVGIRSASWNIQKVVIEYPGVWAGSAASMAASASGDLIKLAAVVGGYTSIASLQWGAEVVLLSPQMWMKSMNKDAVKFRVERATGIVPPSSHVSDAIGIGLHLKGRLSIPNSSRPFLFKEGKKA